MGRSLNIDNFKEILLAEMRKTGDAPTLRLRHQYGNWRSLMGSRFGFLVRGLARTVGAMAQTFGAQESAPVFSVVLGPRRDERTL